MKREFEKCCYRANPIFRTLVCSLACLCKKRGRKGKQGENLDESVQCIKRKAKLEKQGKTNVQDKLWNQDQGPRLGQSAFWHPVWGVYGDDKTS